jgi:hypothetical protein
VVAFEGPHRLHGALEARTCIQQRQRVELNLPDETRTRHRSGSAIKTRPESAEAATVPDIKALAY